jgi:hypothetical protein
MCICSLNSPDRTWDLSKVHPRLLDAAKRTLARSFPRIDRILCQRGSAEMWIRVLRTTSPKKKKRTDCLQMKLEKLL